MLYTVGALWNSDKVSFVVPILMETAVEFRLPVKDCRWAVMFETACLTAGLVVRFDARGSVGPCGGHCARVRAERREVRRRRGRVWSIFKHLSIKKTTQMSKKAEDPRLAR